MELEPEANLIVLHVEVFGKERSRIIRMALDTGSTYTIIPWNVAEILGYDPASERRRVKLTTASGTERAPLLTLRRLRALGLEVENVEIVCHDLPPESAVDGLLGLSFLKYFDINLHFKRHSLELVDLHR